MTLDTDSLVHNETAPLSLSSFPSALSSPHSVAKKRKLLESDGRDKDRLDGESNDNVKTDIDTTADRGERSSLADYNVRKESTFVNENKRQMSKHKNDTACICGRDNLFDGCLGWVRCKSCGDLMHGRCAGFDCEKQIKDLPDGVWCSEARCHCCVATKHSSNPVNSRATLIITPPSILEQWQREICRHINDQETGSKVVIYPGIREICAQGKVPDLRYSHVRNLADADIVLTTFQALMVSVT